MREISERCERLIGDMTRDEFMAASAVERQFVTARNQANIALGMLYAGAFTDALSAGSMAQKIFDKAVINAAAPQVQAARTSLEYRKGGGRERGKQLSETRRNNLDICQSLADEIWASVPESRRRTSSLRYKKELAPKVREHYRRAGHGEPPTAKWIKENIIHPKKNPCS